jgi:hypothetical protein
VGIEGVVGGLWGRFTAAEVSVEGGGWESREEGERIGWESITDRMACWYSAMKCSDMGSVSGRIYGMSGQREISSGCGSLPYWDSNCVRKSASSGSSGGRRIATSACSRKLSCSRYQRSRDGCLGSAGCVPCRVFKAARCALIYLAIVLIYSGSETVLGSGLRSVSL